jgi:hypothetical protein
MVPGRSNTEATTLKSLTALSAELRRAEAAHGEHEKQTGQKDANYSQSYFYYSNFAASVNVSPNGIGPLDPNTKIGGYTILNARAEGNNIAGSKVHAAAHVRNMLNQHMRSAVLASAQLLVWTP